MVSRKTPKSPETEEADRNRFMYSVGLALSNRARLGLYLICFTGLAFSNKTLGDEPATNLPAVSPESGVDLYVRGMQLYQLQKFAEADTCLQAAIAPVPGRPLPYYFFGAVCTAVDIQERLGHGDTAVSYLTRAIKTTEDHAAKTNDVESIRVRLELLGYLREIYDRHGKIGALLSAFAQPEDALSEVTTIEGGRPAFEEYSWWWSHFWELKCGRGLVLIRLARFDEAEALLKEVAEQTTKMGHLGDPFTSLTLPPGSPLPKGFVLVGAKGLVVPQDRSYAEVAHQVALDWLSLAARLQEQVDEAVRYREEVRSLDRKLPRGNEPVHTERYIKALINRDGTSDRTWALMNETLDEINRTMDFKLP